ncbi:hypothetical protein [Streptomyces collinus]
MRHGAVDVGQVYAVQTGEGPPQARRLGGAARDDDAALPAGQIPDRAEA